ncbi:sodium-dependent bicarbonate transport family permease [Sphingomonas sp.]|uniref:sodium-dependent bicarbonate transport family permease n=1 Tax=Sphingomonas sp. TaxID=28214 RepID=UPI00181D5694|nr:sodium-dependent bicarbonate transport family permease [Sphingomonas sp.]MBA4761298.1 sodium-dependent bicarbonate transport family permease [Sphingomonas sp.]
MSFVEPFLSPVILFFLLGALAALARSDLAIPESIAKAMSLYLMAAIGLKGGVSVAAHGFEAGLIWAALAALALSFFLPLPAFALLRKVGRLDATNAGAVAAHYGSVSVVTYVTASEMLRIAGTPPAGYMVAALALMETPAIVTGLLLARRGMSGAASKRGSDGLWHEVLLNGAVVLLIGSFVIGMIAGPDRFAPVAPVFEGGFRGILCLFLLDMGLIAVRRLRDARALTLRLAAIAILLPVLNGIVGVAIGSAIGLDVGSAAALGVLAASASYIAVPAAMRLALPAADPGLYLAMSLGITFPFNVVIGIPAIAALARMMAA